MHAENEAEENIKIRIVSYNINGLENKYLYPYFFKYLLSFEIMALQETHLTEEKVGQAEKYFPGYEICWTFATKNNRFGRAVGGILLAVKRSIVDKGVRYEFDTRSSVKSIKLIFGHQKLTLIPLYIRGANWENEFTVLKKHMEDTEVLNPILVGDVNIRIGELQQSISRWQEQYFSAGKNVRRSKDKEINAKGRTYLEFCTDYDLVVLNGQTQGDEEGNFTFINSIGESVNDICAVSQNLLQYVGRFYVDDKIWSDHLPIVLDLGINTIDRITNKLNLLPKISWKHQEKNIYQTKLNINLSNLAQQESIVCIKQLTDIIKHSSQQNTNETFIPKNKWFNIRCHWARKKAFQCLNKFRKTEIPQDKEAYIRAKSNFNEICKIAKQRYQDELCYKINNINNGKDWWRLVKEINNQDFRVGNAITSAMFRDYFKQLLNPMQTAQDFHYAPLMTYCESLDKDISVQDIKNMLLKIKVNKAPGEDRIPYEFFTNATDEFLVELARVYNKIYKESCIDAAFIKTIIFPIHKKGPVNAPSNYRGISFMNSAAKILMGILNERLISWVEERNVLVEYQAGFRRKYSTADNVYNLASIVNIKLAEKKKVYTFFVDFSAAFDKVSRKALIYKLYSIGVSYKYTKMIETIYANTQSAVWNGEELSDYFNTLSGVKQGCLLSPLLFALYINDLHEYLEGGLTINGENIRILLYADDIAIMADERNTLQKMILNLEQYCDLWNLEVNMTKSKIMVFRNGGRLANQERWFFKQQEIEIVSEYSYLGVVLTPKMSFANHVQSRSKQAKNAINSTWNNFLIKRDISLQSKWKLFLAVCRSIQGYAAQVWGYSYFYEVDKLQRFFLKRTLRLPENTPNYAIDIETNVDDGHIYTLHLQLQYAYRAMFKYGRERLPHFLTKILLEKKIFWVKHINELLIKYNELILEVSTPETVWTGTTLRFLERIKADNKCKKIGKAMQSSTRIYKYLDYSRGSLYINDAYNLTEISWILKARCDMIYLNGNRYSTDDESSDLCSLCNLQETETLHHFIGKCPIMNSIRRCFFGNVSLTHGELVGILNGRRSTDWSNLVKYLEAASQYRKLIINEFQ